MVQDQRNISWTQMAILEMPQNGSLSTFSCNLYHEEFIFFTFHAKSGHRKIFKKFLYLAPYPHIDFTIEAGKKFMSKKKATRNWLTFIKKAFHREFHIVIGHLSMFSLFWFWPQTRRGFFCWHFFEFFQDFRSQTYFPQYRGLYLSGEIGFCFFVMGERSSFHWYLI